MLLDTKDRDEVRDKTAAFVKRRSKDLDVILIIVSSATNCESTCTDSGNRLVYSLL